MPPLYDPPPPPPGVSPDARYLGECYAHGTRAVLRAIGKEREQPPTPGLAGWLSARLGALPQPVQTSLALGAVYLVLQLGGALYERLAGHPPPQPTQPVITQPVSTAAAATGEP
jgi:hypothetical protein